MRGNGLGIDNMNKMYSTETSGQIITREICDKNAKSTD